jgi:hypothetical protein
MEWRYSLRGAARKDVGLVSNHTHSTGSADGVSAIPGEARASAAAAG